MDQADGIYHVPGASVHVHRNAVTVHSGWHISGGTPQPGATVPLVQLIVNKDCKSEGPAATASGQNVDACFVYEEKGR
jgi:hypothetical protein